MAGIGTALLGLAAALAPTGATAQTIDTVWECRFPAACEADACNAELTPLLVFLATLERGEPAGALLTPSGALPMDHATDPDGTIRMMIGRKPGVVPLRSMSLHADGSALVSIWIGDGASATVGGNCVVRPPAEGDG